MAHKCKCVICRHYGYDQDKSFDYDKASLFSEEGKEIRVTLCKVHAVELFKIGQKKFLLNHYKILVDLVDSDDIGFLEVLEETVKRNINALY